METYTFALWIASFALEVILLLRGKQTGSTTNFPFFYSFITYIFVGSLFTFITYMLRPKYYADAYWFYLLVSLLAQFAVLTEISDHIFKPFPAIRQLGRFLAISICVLFSLVYILPSLVHAGSSSVALLQFALRVSLTQAVIVAVLALVAHYYRLPLGRNVGGLMLGLALYVGVNVANYAAATEFGRALYAQMLWFTRPLAFTLCLFVWAVALWQSVPLPETGEKTGDSAEETWRALSAQLFRFHTALRSMLKK